MIERIATNTRPYGSGCRMWRFAAMLPVLASLGWVIPAQASDPRCARSEPVAERAEMPPKRLPTITRKIFAGESLRIVALGSSSTEGTPDMPRSSIYASVLERELARELLTPVEIVNKGKGGETIPKMADRVERDVISLKPDLVVWQLGVNDVLQMDGVEGAVLRMQSVLDELRSHDVPVVLVDLQVAPMVDRDKDTPVMQAAITEAGKRPGVVHFHRQALMRRLIDSRDAEMKELVQPDGLHMTEFAHFCTGSLLARQIARASLGASVVQASLKAVPAETAAPVPAHLMTARPR